MVICLFIYYATKAAQSIRISKTHKKSYTIKAEKLKKLKTKDMHPEMP